MANLTDKATEIMAKLGCPNVFASVGPTGLVSLDSTNAQDLTVAVSKLVNGGCRFVQGETEPDADGVYWATVRLPLR